MEGDYYRYGAEAAKDAEKEEYKAKAKQAYTTASELCSKKVPLGSNAAKEAGREPPAPDGNEEDELPATNPIRLGLALNYSVFMYEILEQRDEATTVARRAFDDAIDKLDELNEDQYRDSTLIMQLLKDNLSLWQENQEDGDEMQ